MADRWRPAWADIDLDAVRHNAALLSGLTRPAALCAVVKADGYGHGDVPVARAALEGGASWLAVALVEEGVTLREAGIEAPILLLSEPPVDGMAEAVARSLVPTVYTREGSRRSAGRSPRPGSPRRGPPQGGHGDAPGGCRSRRGSVPGRSHRERPRLELGALWTHLAVADGDTALDREFTGAQLGSFDAVVKDLAARATVPP